MSHFWSSIKLRLRVESDDGHEQIVSVDRPYGILGSGKDCDVQIDSVAKHAVMVFEVGGVARALVLAGRSKHAGRSFRIDPNHPVPLGNYRVAVLLEDSDGKSQDERPSASLEDTTVEENTVYAVTWKSAEQRQFLQLREAKPILIGRKDPCQIQIHDQRLSGQHGVLLRHGRRLWVIDLHTANGTTVGSEPVTCTSLDPNKSMVLGTAQRVHFVRFHTDETMQTQARFRAHQRIQLDECESALQASGVRVATLTEEVAEFDAIRRSLESQVDQAKENAQRLVGELQQHEREKEEFVLKELSQREAAEVTACQLADVKHAIDDVRHERDQLQAQIGQLEQELAVARQFADANRAVDEVRHERDQLQAQVGQLEQELITARKLVDAGSAIDEVRHERDQLQTQVGQLEQELAAARNLSDTDAIRQRERELETLQEELKAEREILNHLQLQVKSTSDCETSAVSEDETCISSFDFQDMLEEAWDGLPSIEEE